MNITMSHKNAFLIYTCPVLIIMFAICLVIYENHKMDRNELSTEIKDLKMEIDSLHKVNEELKLTNQKYQADKERYIKLDVTGVSHRGGGVVVNNNTLAK